jgi:hypothetical protein
MKPSSERSDSRRSTALEALGVAAIDGAALNVATLGHLRRDGHVRGRRVDQNRSERAEESEQERGQNEPVERRHAAVAECHDRNEAEGGDAVQDERRDDQPRIFEKKWTVLITRPWHKGARHDGCHGSVAALMRRPPARAPLLRGACSAASRSTDRAEIAPEQHRPTSLSHRGLCGVSDASHRATHKEVGHGEP